MKPPSKKAMIARRTRKGFNPEESAVLLDELLAQDMHPDALFLSLVYEETYAQTTCPRCDRGFTVRIVRTRGGVSTGPTGIVVVPWHRTAQED